MLGQVNITDDGTTIILSAPYNEAWSPAAKRLGGRWVAHRKTWNFPAARFGAVVDLVREVYGDEQAARGTACAEHFRQEYARRLDAGASPGTAARWAGIYADRRMREQETA
jgi:hypothetical protein